jgi:hypothetical protein
MVMKKLRSKLLSAMVGALLVSPAIAATTPGTVRLTGTISDYTGGSNNSTSHFTVAWVTKADGTFIKTLWLQGPGFSSKEWGDHTPTYNNARAGSTALDGFSGATATTYAAPAGNPVDVTWNCRDAAGNMMPDGPYNFYIQYTESQTVNGVIIEGPITSPLSWVKGTTAATVTPTNQGVQGAPAGGSNFTGMSIVWTPATVAPAITSAVPASTGTMGTPYNHTCTATGSPHIIFSVSSGSLPTGLSLTPAGVISGTPVVAGTFTGTISADNGLAPANQPFSIKIAEAIVFTNTAPDRGNRVTEYNHAYSVIGTAPVTFTVDSGSLPTGLTMDSQGVISGTPTTLGTFTGKIRAKNGLAADALKDFSIVIKPATEGYATLMATISDYTGGSNNSIEHYTAVWVTDAAGKFIKTLWKQGAGFTSKEWNDHLPTYNNARAGSTALDGFSSATAFSYASPNNPVTVTWNGRDADGNLVDDGDYKFWIQYSENQRGVPGPVTTGGLTWTKRDSAFSVNPPAQGTQGSPVNTSNFTDMTIAWTLAPQIVVQDPNNADLMEGSVSDFGELEIDTVGTPRTFTIKNAGAVDLNLTTLSLYGTGATDFAVTSPLVKTLAPGASTTFMVTFKPTVLGMSMASLEIASNDADQNPFAIDLMGTATPPPAPEIVVQQPAGSSLVDGKAKKSFGTVKTGKSSATKTFTIKNTGTAPLTGLKVLKGSNSSNEFVVGEISAKSINPGKSATFKVLFRPKNKGSRSETIFIKSNDADESPFSIKLVGEGVK